MLRLFLLFLSFSFSILHAAPIETYFKKIVDKSGSHQIRNIDFIYMINLDQRPEKFAGCVEQLAPFGITPYRFSAVNGWELTPEIINDLGVKYESWMGKNRLGSCFPVDGKGEFKDEFVREVGKTYFCHHYSRGSIGIILSHLSILQDAYDSGYETIWVMEDDIKIVRDPLILSDMIQRLDALVGKEGWDILFTDQDSIARKSNLTVAYLSCTAYSWRPNFTPACPEKAFERVDVSSEFRRTGARYGAYSMLVRRSGMKKILDFFKQYRIYLPFDMDYVLPPDMHLYTVIDDVVSTQLEAPTDNAKPNYKERSSP